MIIFFGFAARRRELTFRQKIQCPVCQRKGHLRGFAIFDTFTLFFISTFKWNKRYYVETDCCHNVFEVDAKTGDKMWWGHSVQVDMDTLFKQSNLKSPQNRVPSLKVCGHCGFSSMPDYYYCPKCGKQLP